MLLDTVITRVLVRSFLNLAAAIRKSVEGGKLTTAERQIVIEFVESIEGSMAPPTHEQCAPGDPFAEMFTGMEGDDDASTSSTAQVETGVGVVDSEEQQGKS